MKKIRYIFLLFFLVSLQGLAQKERYFVTFNDKVNSPYSIDNPQQFLSPKSIQRRIKQSIPITPDDLPVNSMYMEGLRSLGVEVYYSSKWFNGVLVQMDLSLVSAVEALSYVQKVEFIVSGAPLSGGRIAGFDKNELLEIDSTSVQNSFLGITEMHNDGVDGSGVDVAVLDAGFLGVNTALPFGNFYANHMGSTFDFVGNSKNVFQYHSHGTMVLSVMAADIPGAFVSIAPRANYHLFITEDVFSETRIEEYNWLFAAEKADSLGVDIITSSLGYFTFDDAADDYTWSDLDGNTSIITRAADWAADKGIVVVTSAGNTYSAITMPSDCNHCLSIGSITNEGIKSNFSSVGPTYDGRIKPDVVAMGTKASVINSSGTIQYVNGTSLSAPQVTGLIAGFIEANPTLTGQEIVEMIKFSSTNSANPDNEIGYGIPHWNSLKNYLAGSLQDEFMLLYPNPLVGEILRIRTKDPNELKVAQCIIYEMSGKKVKSFPIQLNWLKNEMEVDLRELMQGMYIIEIKNDKYRFIDRIMKQ